MEFSQEQKAEIEELSGAGFNPKKISMIMNLPWLEIKHWYSEPDSEFRYHYDRGMLLNEAARDKEVNASAKNGSITAIQLLESKLRSRKLDELRERLLNGDK